MTELSAAEEHLRVIRSLMEKATTYRAVSAQGALVSGLAAVATGVIADQHVRWSENELGFIATWCGVLLLAVTANLLFLRREAQKRGDPLVSPGMRMAARGFIPPMLCGAVFTFSGSGHPTIWMIFYGLGLLATAHFAPKSIGGLGRSFLIAGCFLWVGTATGIVCLADSENWLMALTFGLFHLIYAACTWPKKPARNSSEP